PPMPMPAGTTTGWPSTNTSRWACTWKNSCSDLKAGSPAAATHWMAFSGRGQGAGPELISRCGGTAGGDVDALELFDEQPPPQAATTALISTESATARKRDRMVGRRRWCGPAGA